MPLCPLASTPSSLSSRRAYRSYVNLLYKQVFMILRPRQSKGFQRFWAFTNGIPCYSRAYLHLYHRHSWRWAPHLAGSETVTEPLTILVLPLSAMFSVLSGTAHLCPQPLHCHVVLGGGIVIEQDDHGVSTVEGHHIDIYVVVRFRSGSFVVKCLTT